MDGWEGWMERWPAGWDEWMIGWLTGKMDGDWLASMMDRLE